MNFFAHFEVARALSVSRSAALGAMLPDLLPMCGAKLAEPTGRELARGVALHHRTDAVFHLADGFVRQTSEARQSLAALGLRRGPALAVAHVGVELQLDGWLAKEHDPADLFEVLRSPGDIWADGDSARRFAQLVERLARLGIPSTYADPESCAGGLQRMLASRPRLALDADEPANVRLWLDRTAPHVSTWARPLFDDVVARLNAENSPAHSTS